MLIAIANVSLTSKESCRDFSSAPSTVAISSKLKVVLLVRIANLKALYSFGKPLIAMCQSSSSSKWTPTTISLSLTTFIFCRYTSTVLDPLRMLWSSSLRFITCDLEMEENRFSRTFHMLMAEVHPTVSASTDDKSVELINVNKAFSLDFQIWKFGLIIVVIELDRSLRNLSRTGWNPSRRSNIA